MDAPSVCRPLGGLDQLPNGRRAPTSDAQSAPNLRYSLTKKWDSWRRFGSCEKPQNGKDSGSRTLLIACSQSIRDGSGFGVRQGREMLIILWKLWVEEEGQDLTEYALLLILLALASIAAMSNFALAISTAFSSAAQNLSAT